MQVFRCKICGGAVIVDRVSGIAVCEYCGTKQVLPRFLDDSSKRLYESGHHYLQNGEYDKAEIVFNKLLAVNPQDAEVYWDLVLCKYGVTFVQDPKTEKYIPTCNRTHYESILNDKNYQSALKYSDAEQRAFYQENAETINNIQKGILSVSKKEKPFDIFISYKETNSEGNRTKDSITAQTLYEKLTESGYKVFFSRITLEDKIGAEYEPYIYAALYSSKVMLTVCSSKENIESPWVRNEWSRFLTLRQNDASKTLIPLYFDMPKSDLPDEFDMLSSYDMKVDGFEQELLRGIKKLIPLPIMKATRRKKARKTVGITAAVVCVTAAIIAAVVLPNYFKAQRLEEQYTSAVAMFENADYERASTVFSELGDYKDSAEMVEKCAIQPEYDAAMQLYYDGNYAEATWAFEALGDYEDSAEQKKQAELSWRKSLATVYAEGYNEYASYGGFEKGYYIARNGSVENTKGFVGNAHTGIEIIPDGKVISLGQYEPLFALHENGRVTNTYFVEQLADNLKWDNIVKISSFFQNKGFISLRADGKMLMLPEKGYGTCTCEYDQMLKMAAWSEIVDFKYTYSYAAHQGWVEGYLVGLKSDGTLCGVSFLHPYSEKDDVDRIPAVNKALDQTTQSFYNVKKFAVCGQGTKLNGSEISIVAITKDNKLLTYINGEFEEADGKDICDVISTDSVLKKNGDLIELSSGKVLLRDIVYAGQYSDNAYFAVTRNGNINLIKKYDGKTTIQRTENKTTVYDEWLARLN